MHRHSVFSTAAIAALIATAACNPFHKTPNEIKVQDIPVGERWNATLASPSTLSGAVQIHGTGYVARDPSGSSKAVIHIANATAGGVHPWAVRVGLCGTDNPVYGDLSAYQNLKVDKDGTAQSGALLSVPFPTSGSYSLEVRASPSNMGTVIACGNLAPPTQ
ncbi:MAG: hypothetical protein JJD97_10595 [Gemmatimonadaceae bacterium]|nr:hypothetical protein [Gemmatimonadaceae bacterium]